MASVLRTDSPDALGQALARLREGGLVGFPTGSAYHLAASGLSSQAVKRLQELASRDRLAVALAFPSEVFDWLPYLRGPGLRIARRLWPGQCTLVADYGVAQGLLAHLPAEVQSALAPDGQMAVTAPNHARLRQAAFHLQGPLLIAAPGLARSAQELASAAGDEVALILEDDATPDPQLPTVVAVEGRNVRVQREGAVPSSEVEEALPCRIVFVCTGNTCRSPMAQALCARMLADWLGCSVDALPRHGFIVESAGLAALSGEEASPEGVEAIRRWNADLQGHRSQPITYELLAHADFVLAMTRSHLRILRDLQVEVGPRPRLLSCEGDDVSDPIGGPPEVYEACAAQIHACLEKILPELQENR